jgi:hypothetical protein
MNKLRIALAAAFVACAGLAIAQGAERGSTPPGTSQDGSSPAEGALKGGSIQPGERSGMPDRTTWRCNQLSGSLREQCLKDAESASGGTTTQPKPDPNVRDPRQAPPPQNPR